MQNISTALNPKNPDLSSSADVQQGLKAYYYPFKVVAGIIEDINASFIQRRERERAKGREKDIKAIKQDWAWKLKKGDNLRIACAILVNQKHRIELIPPNFDQQAFIEAVEENFNYVTKWLLADKVYEMYDQLNDKINEITCCNDVELYWQYHTHNPNAVSNFVTADHNGNPVYYYGVDEPTPELAEMEVERDLLMNLSDQLDHITTLEPSQEELEIYKQALEG
jgi:hypothetical protein